MKTILLISLILFFTLVSNTVQHSKEYYKHLKKQRIAIISRINQEKQWIESKKYEIQNLKQRKMKLRGRVAEFVHVCENLRSIGKELINSGANPCQGNFFSHLYYNPHYVHHKKPKIPKEPISKPKVSPKPRNSDAPKQPRLSPTYYVPGVIYNSPKPNIIILKSPSPVIDHPPSKKSPKSSIQPNYPKISSSSIPKAFKSPIQNNQGSNSGKLSPRFSSTGNGGQVTEPNVNPTISIGVKPKGKPTGIASPVHTNNPVATSSPLISKIPKSNNPSTNGNIQPTLSFTINSGYKSPEPATKDPKQPTIGSTSVNTPKVPGQNPTGTVTTPNTNNGGNKVENPTTLQNSPSPSGNIPKNSNETFVTYSEGTKVSGTIFLILFGLFFIVFV